MALDAGAVDEDIDTGHGGGPPPPPPVDGSVIADVERDRLGPGPDLGGQGKAADLRFA